MDTKNGSGNAANEPHIDIIWRFYVKGREDNPLHTDAFNELIENLKEKNTTWNKTTFNCERSVSRTLFTEENSDGAGDR